MSGPGVWHKTLCPYCGVGCGLLARVEDGAVVRTKGDPAHPANFGDICAKAVHLPPVLRTPDRLLYPQLRARRDAELARVPWEMALRVAAERMREIVTRHAGERVLVVSHKATIRLVLSSLLGFDGRGYRDRLDQAPACLNVLDFKDPVRARLMLFNDVSHYSGHPIEPKARSL